MAKKAAKPAAKKIAVKTKDLETKKNPKGGARITKADLIKLQ